MRKGRPSSRALQPVASSRNHPCMGRKKEGGSLMERAFRRLRDRFRRRLATITASFSRLFASLTPPVRGFASQRMCPFCGLITSRSKSSCLECGKSLAPATTRYKRRDEFFGTIGRSPSATLELEKEINMLWTIFVVLLILWLLGFSLHVAGGLIHILLVVALVILVINLVSGRRVA